MSTLAGDPPTSLGFETACMVRMVLERQTLGVREGGASTGASDPVPKTPNNSCDTGTLVPESGHDCADVERGKREARRRWECWMGGYMQGITDKAHQK